MVKSNYPLQGKMICFEGIDGAGKSSQISRIVSFLQEHDCQVLVTREPGGTALGEKLRALLLTEEMNVSTELLLMFAARNEHLREVIMPALQSGIWVVSDRFCDASYAYQVGGGGLDSDFYHQIEQSVLGDFRADLTLLFDIKVDIAEQRINQQGRHRDRFERKDKKYHERVRQAYLDRVAQQPQRFFVLDATQTEQQLTERMLTHIQQRWF